MYKNTNDTKKVSVIDYFLKKDSKRETLPGNYNNVKNNPKMKQQLASVKKTHLLLGVASKSNGITTIKKEQNQYLLQSSRRINPGTG